MLQEALPHEIAELQLLSNLRTNEEFRKVLPKLEKTFFERPEHRVVFGMLKDYITEFNEPPTKEQLKVNLATVGFTKEDHFEDGLEPQINHTIDALSDQPDNTDWLLTRAQQLYVEHTMMPLTLEFYKNIKAGKAPDFTKLQDAAKASLIDEGDGTKLKLETITHHFEQGKTLAEQLKNPSYRIKHLLPENGVGILTGPSGTGKTFMLDHMIAHLITGRKYFGKRVKPCNVLYVYAEGGAADIELRLEAHNQHYGNDDFNTEHHRLSIAPCIWNLCDESIIAEIIAYIIKHDIKFVVLETLGAMLMDGTVNDDEVVRKYIAGAKKIADQCNCTLLIVHHPPKGGSSDYLGSVTIKNNPDFLWILWKLDEEGKRDDDYKDKEIMLELYCDKCKFAPDGWKCGLLRKEIVIGIDDEGDEMTSLVIENLTPDQKAEMIANGKVENSLGKFVKLSENAKKLEAIRKDCFEGRDIISRADLNRAAKTHSMTKGDDKTTISRIAERGVKALKEAGVKVELVGENVVWGDKAAVTSVAMIDVMFVQ
jgi:AAA domain